MSGSASRGLGAILAVNRTAGVVLVSLLFFGLGEQLWGPFFPSSVSFAFGCLGAALFYALAREPVDRPTVVAGASGG